MDAKSRLEYMRERVKKPLPLTPAAAVFVEEVRRNDPDLGTVDSFGVLPPESVEVNREENNDDEEIRNVSLISPLMRVACDV